MTLEFQKLTDQVDQLGAYIAEQEEELDRKVDIAVEIMAAHADPAMLAEIDARVQDAIDKDAGYRGARPVDEPIMSTFPPAPLPGAATVVATDGSQVLPNPHGAALYYLLNIGTIVMHYGSGEPPQVTSEPYLFFDHLHLQTETRGVITPNVVGARRTVAEISALAERSWDHSGMARPLISLLDGPLVFVMAGDVPDRDQLRRTYFSAMNRLLEVKAGLAGYIDRPRSTFVVNLLHLLDIPSDEVSRRSLSTAGRIEGVRDTAIFRYKQDDQPLLPSSHRSAIFIQMSPQNKEFKQEGGEMLEVAFFYMNVAAPDEPPQIVRVEVPVWVAQDRALVAEMQSLIYHQCQQTVIRYPYVLTRADELAVVKREENTQLDMMIRVALTRHAMPLRESSKQAGKDAARSRKTRFDVGGRGRQRQELS